MKLSHILNIFLKELSIDFRQKYAVGGIFLFAAALVYIIFKAYNVIQPREWTILIWVIMLFVGLSAIVKSFVQENRETYIYYYTLFDPLELIVAKLIYNFIFLGLLFMIIIGLLYFFSGYPVKDGTLFYIGSMWGIMGMSIIFTFVSVISSSESGNSTLMSILALPLVLPILLLLLKISAVSVRLISDTSVWDDVWLLAGIDSIMLGAIIMLFPGLWRN
jgi:heme exporter protein B